MKNLTLSYTFFLFILLLNVPKNSLAQLSINDIIKNSFELKNTDGKVYSLNSFGSKKAIVIIFDSNLCPFSKAYNERIKNIHKNYTAKGIQLVLINSNDSEIAPGDSYERMISYAKNHSYEFPYLKDDDQEVARYFGATNTPQVFIVTPSKNGLKLKYKGTIDNNYRDATKATKHYVNDALDAILQNKNIAVDETKAIGCTIKWRN